MQVVSLEQGSPAWLSWRLGGLGSSDAAVILHGKHFDRTRHSLWVEKTGPPREDAPSWAMLQGKKFEPEVRAWYEDLTGVEAPPLCCQHDLHPWLRASLDGWVADAGLCVEIKYARREWHLEAIRGRLPHAYEPQCDHQLLVTGAKRLHYVSFNPASPPGRRGPWCPFKGTPGGKERAVPLPDDLAAALDAFAGETWLWENYLPGLKAALKAKGFPTHQLKDEFSPQRLYYWVETQFADYRTAHKDRPALTTHMFRKRAFTMAWRAGIDMRQASIAYGCNVDTLMRHYVALDEQQVTDNVFARMHGGKRKRSRRRRRRQKTRRSKAEPAGLRPGRRQVTRIGWAKVGRRPKTRLPETSDATRPCPCGVSVYRLLMR
jgi:putative phage-type endonuclease